MMDQYEIRCTPEQTKKALQLGAPIELESEYYSPTEHDFKLDSPIPCSSYTYGYPYAKCPTAEQMIGWLEEQGRIKEIAIFRDSHTWSYIIIIDGRSHVLCEKFESRKEATLAAIDAALEYLSNNKK